MQPLPSSANLISEFSMGRVNAPVKVAHFFFLGVRVIPLSFVIVIANR